jgi:hypothetical protein
MSTELWHQNCNHWVADGTNVQEKRLNMLGENAKKN